MRGVQLDLMKWLGLGERYAAVDSLPPPTSSAPNDHLAKGSSLAALNSSAVVVTAPTPAKLSRIDARAFPSSLQPSLAQRLQQPVRVSFNNNRRTMITWTKAAGVLHLRLHRMFMLEHGNDPIVEALALYIQRGDRRASSQLNAYIRAHAHQVDDRPAPVGRLHARGEAHDLQCLFDSLNATWFERRVEAQVTWGNLRRRSGRRVQRSIRLGTYCPQRRLIRIHPALDQSWVPSFFVAFVVFHEMLHHIVPAEPRAGQQCFHTPRFRAMERRFPEYERAIDWERRHIDRLLRSLRKSVVS